MGGRGSLKFTYRVRAYAVRKIAWDFKLININVFSLSDPDSRLESS